MFRVSLDSEFSMKSARTSFVMTTLVAFLLAGCGGSGGPDASGAVKSTAPPAKAPEKTKLKIGRRAKTGVGQEPVGP